jgi:hypothetical protein
MDDAHGKISSTYPRKFRPGPVLDALIEELLAKLAVRNPQVEFSATIRDGLLAFWPQIAAYLIARQESGVAHTDLARLVGSCAKAIEMGVTPDQLEARLMGLVDELQASPGGNVTRFPGTPRRR